MNSAIKVENLGKKYIICHQLRQPYLSLRDATTSNLKNMAHRLLGRGHDTARAKVSEEFWALREINFDIPLGGRVGIIGRNGAGKSTLLKVLSRITEPSTGRITISGRIASLLEVGTGFHPELTGRENISLNGAVLGMSKAYISRKFDEIVAFAEVEQFLDTPVKHYSSGMYVRLAFAVAAHLEPEILIVDEVLSVGDAQFQKKCLGKMEDVGKEGRTVLFVSHSMSTIARLCDNCILLNKGKLVANGPTEAVIRDYLLGEGPRTVDYDLPHDQAKDMHLRKVSLNPDVPDRSVDVRYDQSIAIRIEYEINRSIYNCTVWLALQTMEGVIVFVTADHDLESSLLENRDAGYYVTDVEVPAAWLNVGEYNIIVGVVKNNPVIVYNREETLTFNVVEIGTPGSKLKDGVRRGVLQPYLRWSKPLRV